MDIIGFFFEGSRLRSVHLRKQRGNVEVVARDVKLLYKPGVKPGTDVKPLYMPEARLAGAVPSMLRSIELPVTSLRKAMQGLPFQLESLSHVPAEELVYATELSKQPQGIEAKVFFTRKTTLTSFLEFDPDLLCPAPIALVAFAQFRWPEVHEAILVHQETCTWMEKGKVKKSLTVPDEEKQSRLEEIIGSFQATGGKKTVIWLEKEEPHALAIGAALHSLEPRPQQFLTGDLTPQKTLRARGKMVSALLAAGLVAAGVLLLLGQAQSKHLKNLAENPEIEKAVAVSKRYPTELSYILQVPTVTETLSWLSNHPLATTFHLLSVDYQLTSFPQVETPKAPFEAAVKLELLFHNPTLARKFHDALLEEKTFINQAKEVSWTASEDRYRISFHLKRRPPHVF